MRLEEEEEGDGSNTKQMSVDSKERRTGRALVQSQYHPSKPL
jgi:hypothetical protein